MLGTTGLWSDITGALSQLGTKLLRVEVTRTSCFLKHTLSKRETRRSVHSEIGGHSKVITSMKALYSLKAEMYTEILISWSVSTTTVQSDMSY